MRAEDILSDQVIHLKRGRTNAFGWEPCWNSYFDFYLDGKYFGEPLLELQDVTFHLYLRKNLNDRNPQWKMPTIRQIRKKFTISYGKIYAMLERLERAHLLNKYSGVRVAAPTVRNSYLLSDPIPTLDEFLEVASQELFKLTLLPQYACNENRNTSDTEIVTSGVTETVTDQQTLNTQQTVDDSLENRLWRNVLKQLQTQLPADSYNTFLADTIFTGVSEGVAVITTNRNYAKEYLENRMGSLIKKVLGLELKLNGGQKLESIQFEIEAS